MAPHSRRVQHWQHHTHHCRRRQPRAGYQVLLHVFMDLSSWKFSTKYSGVLVLKPFRQSSNAHPTFFAPTCGEGHLLLRSCVLWCGGAERNSTRCNSVRSGATHYLWARKEYSEEYCCRILENSCIFLFCGPSGWVLPALQNLYPPRRSIYDILRTYLRRVRSTGINATVIQICSQNRFYCEYPDLATAAAVHHNQSVYSACRSSTSFFRVWQLRTCRAISEEESGTRANDTPISAFLL